MGDIQTRPFSKNYSGLINQSVIALGITLICISGHEYMKRKRRGKHAENSDVLGSRESWEFGYLYQGRSWAKIPSPPSPTGWPLCWAKQVIEFPEMKMLELRGIDATLYARFLRGCFWFTLLHTFSTFPILFPIHLNFSEETVPPKSMTRASISSLVGTAKGRSLLWIHICLLFWVTLTWMMALLWICDGAFKFRKARLKLLPKRLADSDTLYYPHPHPQYGFADIPIVESNHLNRGLRLRTVMVSNIPMSLRNEKDLKEYFEFYMSRKLEKPSMRLASSFQPSFFNRSLAFLFNRAKRIPNYIPPIALLPRGNNSDRSGCNQHSDTPASSTAENVPGIERVMLTRNMSSIASLLERREAILCLLETAHIKLAKKTLLAVKDAMDRRYANLPVASGQNRAVEIARKKRAAAVYPERGARGVEVDEEARMDELIEVLGPFVKEFGLQESLVLRSKRFLSASSRYAFRKLRSRPLEDSSGSVDSPYDSPLHLAPPCRHKTIWEALHSLSRSRLDAYQPLINLNYLFAGKTVPAIDYYTTKLNMLSSLVTESRSKAPSDYEPLSTAFVTFSDAADARRACKYLAVHPNNPLICMVNMAPMYHDLDWMRVMKSSFDVEFVKDWVVNLGVWAFTLFWLFPVSLLVGLVSIQNISLFWPGLQSYLNRHPWEEELIQSFLPTLLVALLALLIPLILFLIAKKAHNFTTLSAMHDIIMTRYYKFLIVNVLVFFCVGTAALQSLLQSFNPSAAPPDILQVVADSFPSAGPFYVGWLIFTAAIHGGFELALLGLPLILYPAMSRQITPRKRAAGIRPRTFNFYYWLPSHMLVAHVIFLFSVLNPLVIPFGVLYFFVESGVVKHQLIHVYAKNYENDGKVILIRIVRYSLDGLLLAQAIFLAYMVVLKKSVNVGLAAFLILFTVVVKLLMTRMCRAQFEHDDVDEANLVCNFQGVAFQDIQTDQHNLNDPAPDMSRPQVRQPSVLSWRLPNWINFSYATVRPHHPSCRQPNPFRPQNSDFDRAKPTHHDSESLRRDPSFSESPREKYTDYSPTDVSGPVVKHSPPVPWDDETTVDSPYDNPFYTRKFDNVLWLPRDPFGTLNLDDTIDLRASLSVDVAAGQLGSWSNLNESVYAEQTSDKHSPGLGKKSSAGSLRPINGTENIELPPVIARRVECKGDMESTLRSWRPSTSRRKSIGATSASIEAGTVRRPPAVRGDSLQEDIRGLGRGKTSSIFAAAQSNSCIAAQGSLPQIHGQVLSLHTNDSNPRLSVVLRDPPTNITARQAIFNEVLAEERAVMVDQNEDENQAQKAASGKSWLTAWMFNRRE